MIDDRARAGFTMVEAIVALTLSTIIVVLVGSVFLAQNRFYGDVLRRSAVQDDARSVVELVSTDVRPLPRGSFLVADSLELVARLPLSIGFVCDVQGSDVFAYFAESAAGLDTAHVSGFGVRRPDTGTWDYYDGTWDALHYVSGTTVKDACGGAGMDTSNVAASAFVRLTGPGTSATPPPTGGGQLMLFRELALEFAPSILDTGTVGLFRGNYQETPVEFASHLGRGAHFQYRLKGDTAFQASVAGSDLDGINAVRIVAVAVSDPPSGELPPYEYELVREIPLRNRDDG